MRKTINFDVGIGVEIRCNLTATNCLFAAFLRKNHCNFHLFRCSRLYTPKKNRNFAADISKSQAHDRRDRITRTKKKTGQKSDL